MVNHLLRTERGLEADLHLDQLGNRAAGLCLCCDLSRSVPDIFAATVRWTEVMEKPSPSLSMTTSDLLSTCSGMKSAMPSSLTNDTQLEINEVVKEALSLMQHEALRHEVAIRFELASSVPPVRGDRIQLQQVIVNLAVNGMEAMAMVRDRERVLTVRTQGPQSDRVLVAVEDAGVGIEPENINRAFSAFHTTKPDGLGMGLSICRSIIEAHGGQVWASPNAGPGMTFQFTLSAWQGS
jgi:signal transduction histidine kinase